MVVLLAHTALCCSRGRLWNRLRKLNVMIVITSGSAPGFTQFAIFLLCAGWFAFCLFGSRWPSMLLSLAPDLGTVGFQFELHILQSKIKRGRCSSIGVCIDSRRRENVPFGLQYRRIYLTLMSGGQLS